MKKSLLALALGGLGIGITEFSMMGMLPDVAQSLQVSIPEAGYLITAYALGVVIGAPLLVVAMNRFSPLKTLITLMGLFTLFNGLSVIAPDYGLLLVSRFISGLPHGAFFGVGSVIASRLADPGKVRSAGGSDDVFGIDRCQFIWGSIGYLYWASFFMALYFLIDCCRRYFDYVSLKVVDA